jgi:hypothetical protein
MEFNLIFEAAQLDSYPIKLEATRRNFWMMDLDIGRKMQEEDKFR